MGQEAADTKPLRSAKINAHELLDMEQRKMCRIMRTRSARNGEPFTMLDFAKIALCATASDYVQAASESPEAVMTDIAHRRAAILYVYEALKACDIPIIKEWPEFDEMLKNLVYLANELP